MKGAALYIRNPVTKEEKFLAPVGVETSIGKGAGASIVLDVMRCDPLHALVERDETRNEFVIIDLGSHYGTFVRGKKIQEARVKSGEVFLIGNQQVVLRETKTEMPAPAPQPKARTRKDAGSKSLQAGKAGGKAEKLEGDVLQVTLHWGDKLLELKTFDPGQEITLGTSNSATFGVALSDPKYQKIPFRIAKFSKDLVELHIPADVHGLVWTKNDTYAVDYLRHMDKSTTKFTDLKVNLRTGDRADLTFGELTLSFKFVNKGEKIPTQIVPTIDRTFLRVGGILLAVYFAMFIWLWNADFAIPEKTLEDLPAHLKKSVYNAGLAKALQRKRSAIGELAKKEGGRAKGEEGRASAAKQIKKAESAPKPSKKSAPKVVKKQAPSRKQIAKSAKPKEAEQTEAEVKIDLDSAFDSKPSKNTNLAKNAGTESTVERSGNTVAAFSDAGGFARGTKGTGAGGGGESVGIGALKGTSTGGGMGAGDYGILPSKGHEIRVPETEELVILGGLDRDVIASIIKRYLPQIQHCYEQQLVTNSKLKGKVTVSFMISGTGGVQSAEVQDTTLRNAATERCMIQKIMGWKFPKPRGGGTVGVKYPFILMSTSSGDDD
jgi:pSer/pThr/pTyr-binding forkhead associated (FHA) protein